MIRRLRLGLIMVATAAMALAHAVRLEGQQQVQGRFRVLIPNFEPLEGANKKFGEKAAKDLRELVNSLATHQPIEEKEIKKSLRRFKMKMDQLNCIRTRQLAQQISAKVALCASYSEDGKQVTVNAAFWDIEAGESFPVTPVTVGEKEDKVAAQHIFDQFDQYVQQIRYAAFCVDYAQSQQWDNALRNCDNALKLNPKAIATRYQRARILFNTKRYDEALAELKTVLEQNPIHEDALQLAGYISATIGQDDQAREYYNKYLQINPGNAAVRMKIAYDLATAGDPVGAMQLIQKGLDVDPNNIDLWEQYGGFAFSAALEAAKAAGAENGGGLPPEAVELYRKAIQAYEKVFAAKGAETPVGQLRNIIAAYIQLDELDQAIDVAERALQTHKDEASLWAVYADALQRSGRLDDAITALDRVKQIDPSYPNVSLRQGNWLIQAERIDDAVKVLKAAVAEDPQQADNAARLIFGDAYSKGVQKNNFGYAVRGITAAQQIPGVSSLLKSQLNFWLAYSLYQGAVKEQKPGTVETAKKTLPKFQRAYKLFQQSKEYTDTQKSITLSQFLNNTNTYIEIQQAIIKRGR